MKTLYAGAVRTIRSGKLRVGSSTRTITRIVGKLNGVVVQLVRFSTTLSVTASPPTATGYGSSGITTTVTSDLVTATPTGGVPPFSYIWTAGDPAVTATNPNGASTAFSGLVEPTSQVVATAFVTVTDSIGGTSGTQIDITLINGGA